MTRVMIRAVDQIYRSSRLAFVLLPRVCPSPLSLLSNSRSFPLLAASCGATRGSVKSIHVLRRSVPSPLYIFRVYVCACKYILIIPVALALALSSSARVSSRSIALALTHSLTLPISPSLSLSPFLSLDCQLEW